MRLVDAFHDRLLTAEWNDLVELRGCIADEQSLVALPVDHDSVDVAEIESVAALCAFITTLRNSG